jgi:hypothetical protein
MSYPGAASGRHRAGNWSRVMQRRRGGLVEVIRILHAGAPSREEKKFGQRGDRGTSLCQCCYSLCMFSPDSVANFSSVGWVSSGWGEKMRCGGLETCSTKHVQSWQYLVSYFPDEVTVKQYMLELVEGDRQLLGKGHQQQHTTGGDRLWCCRP